MTTAEEILKACPFCGSQARIKEHSPDAFGGQCVSDIACPARNHDRFWFTKEEAIKAWNTRTPLEEYRSTPVGEVPYSEINHEGEREVLAQAFDKVRQIFAGREWVMEGRGSYPYNDDRYKEEVRYMFDEFEAIKNDTWKNITTKTFEYRYKIIKSPDAKKYWEEQLQPVGDVECTNCRGSGLQAGDPEGAPTEPCYICNGQGKIIAGASFNQNKK